MNNNIIKSNYINKSNNNTIKRKKEHNNIHDLPRNNLNLNIIYIITNNI